MYISQYLIEKSLQRLEKVHPFFGITFLVCKRHNLPIGNVAEFAINHLENDFLHEYFKPETTAYFFRPFKISDKAHQWLKPDYASHGSQKSRTSKFKHVFIHPKKSNLWGWRMDYVEGLKNEITESVPLFDLAVWIYRNTLFPSNVSALNIIDRFQKEFNLTSQELSLLFNKDIPDLLDPKLFFDQEPFDWFLLKRNLEISSPPDAKPDSRKSLTKLNLEGIGPSKQLSIDFAKRINILTGDNGLGKTFILETAWRALSGEWAGEVIHPDDTSSHGTPVISYAIQSSSDYPEINSAVYSWKSQDWVSLGGTENEPSLLVYAKVDGSFSVLDPLKKGISNSRAFKFNKDEIWNGLIINDGHKSRFICNGIIADWSNWQNSPDQNNFQIFTDVLKILSPPDIASGDLGILKPGNLTRIPGESRPIPTIKHPYGEVPITSASAGVKRIISLAYIIVWTWLEHKSYASLSKSATSKHIAILIDEIESHLHPKWQRLILPAILRAVNALDKEVSVQFIITSHSPLVLSSIEPTFVEEIDNIFNLALTKVSKKFEVTISNPDFVKYGSVNSWLTSDIFNLNQARSIESEKALTAAKQLLKSLSPEEQEIKRIHNKLLNVLPAHDEFWIRWNFFVSTKLHNAHDASKELS